MASKRKREVSPAPSASVQEVPGEVSLPSGASETPSEKADPGPTLKTTPSEKHFIIITDDEEPSVSDSGPTASVSLADVPEVQPFLGLDKSFKKEQKWLINTLLHQKVATGDAICHLSDVPSDAEWNLKNTLVTSGGRAITIVLFGTLSSINMSIARDKPTSLSVIIDFLREKDVQSLQRLYKLAQVDIAHAKGSLTADRVSSDPRSRIMKVYDMTGQLLGHPKGTLECLGVNALIGGDVMRMDVRCVRVRQAGTMAIRFKLHAVHLLLAVPRSVDK